MKPKYYCHLTEGKTKDGLDIHTLHWISDQIIKREIHEHEINPWGNDIHKYGHIHRIISDVMNREIGT